MKKRILSLALALVMVLSLLPLSASAADFTLVWPVSWAQGTPPAWAVNATEAEGAATIQAIYDEYDYQASIGFDMGTMNGGITAWGNMVNVQFENGDHTGNPWGQAGRRMGGIVSPYAGTAFSIKADYSNFYGVTPLGNETEYTDATGNVNKVQMISNGQLITQAGSTTITRNNALYAGSGAPADVAEQFKMAYAYANAGVGHDDKIALGYTNGAVRTEGGIYFQEFWSNETTGELEGKTGVSYIAGTADGAYVIANDMFNAWIENYGFDKTGAPTGNAYTMDGVTYQDFAKGTLVLEDGKVSGPLDNNTAFTVGFAYEDMAVDGNDYYYLVSDSADLSAFDSGIAAESDKAVISPDMTGKQDFTAPVEISVTAESGRTTEYTITVVSKAGAADEDTAAADEVNAMLAQLPVQIFSNDLADIDAIYEAYDALTTVQKLLVDIGGLDALAQRIAEIEAGDKIRVTCVGDSITEGYRATDSSYSYPAQMQKMLGDSYVVTNCGVSGSNVMTDRGYIYKTTGRYTTSMNSNPDIVIVALGTNDAGNGGWNDTAPAQFEKDYRELLQGYMNLPTKPLVLAALPTQSWNADGTPDSRCRNNINGTMPIIEKVAGELGVQVLDMYSWSEGKMAYFGDRLHPNDEGYGLLAAEYAKYVLAATEEIADISLDGINVDGEALAQFSEETRNYTLTVDSLENLPQVEAVYTDSVNKTVEVKQATAADPTATVIVSSAQGTRGAAYSITFQTYPNPFTDVEEDDYCYAPVLWALRQEITTGATETTFEPDKACTRGQVVTFLWRAAGEPEPSIQENPFTDVEEDDYCYTAILWAVEKKITNGTSATTFEPDKACNRGEVATFLYRFDGENPAEAENPFSDVEADRFYYDAVLWAVENEITTGTEPGKFEPSAECTRGQVVTFLYRYMG